MTLDPHLAQLALMTLVVGWLMVLGGIQKSGLELRRRRKICPSCGREARRACTCRHA